MLERRVAGRVPRKHHIVMRDEHGALMHEECITREGFDGAYSILYHHHRPHTQHLSTAAMTFQVPESVGERPLAKRHFIAPKLAKRGGAWLSSRVPLLFNDDVVLSVLHPDAADSVYFSNSDADDLFFVLEGSGIVRSQYGDLRYGPLDYVCVPRSTIHRFIPDAGVSHFVLGIECKGGVGLLKQWRNQVGQLTMDAPYCHRDFTAPEFTGPIDEGIRDLVVKRGDNFHGFRYETPPLDVAGWDGSVYPWVFPILNFQARAGLVHLPPTWHGTFATRGALICSFVPRALDFHPEAIPCPYPHSSVDCDEFLFYCRGNFTSRRGVGPGSISYHPSGIPHGPHPGAYEASIGHRHTDELAVMLDTFKALKMTKAALEIEDANYQESFV